MAGFVETLRGDEWARIHRALHELETDPRRRRDRTRRLSQSPQPYKSSSSYTTTRSASSELPSDEQRSRELRDQKFKQQLKLMDERAASLPMYQFKAQRVEEARRIWKANPRTSLMSASKIPDRGSEEKEATETIKKLWVEQGIWKNEWDEMAARGVMWTSGSGNTKNRSSSSLHRR